MQKEEGMAGTGKQRNGKIEFFRFVFCVVIIIFHCNRIFGDGGSKEGYELGLFPRGYIGVEFFYLVSGYLLANSLFRLETQQESSMPADREYWKFLWGKLLPILPHHLIAFGALFLQDWFIKQYSLSEMVKAFLSEVPGLFLLQKAGFGGRNLNSVEWYISAMLVAMAVIYAVCRKNFRTYSGIIAPLSAILIMGWIFFNCGAMSGASRKMPLGLGYACLWRAAAEINLGIFAFRIAKILDREEWSGRERGLLSVVEWAGYMVAIVFALFAVPIRYEIIPLFCLFVSVTLTFSSASYKSTVWNQKPVYFLGKLSLPLYLNQLFAIYWIQWCAPEWSLKRQSASALCLAIAVSLVFMIFGDLWLKQIKKSHLHQIITSTPTH